MTTRTITLPDEAIEFAEAEARRRGFGSAGDYVAAVLREERLREAKKRLNALLLEAIESGPGEPVTPEFWERIEREGMARIEAERRGR